MCSFARKVVGHARGSDLLNYLRLPFDEACLHFYENRRAVHTPSAAQVRRPINRAADGTIGNG